MATDSEIIAALSKTHGNKAAAARLLRLKDHQLRNRLARIDPRKLPRRPKKPPEKRARRLSEQESWQREECHQTVWSSEQLIVLCEGVDTVLDRNMDVVVLVLKTVAIMLRHAQSRLATWQEAWVQRVGDQGGGGAEVGDAAQAVWTPERLRAEQERLQGLLESVQNEEEA